MFIMVFLDDNRSVGIEDIDKIRSTLVDNPSPGLSENNAYIPFMMASDGVAKGIFIEKVDSPLTRKKICRR